MSLFWEGGLLFWAITVMTFAAIGIFFDRLLRLRKIGIDPQDFLLGVFNVLDKGQVTEALAICEETPGPLPALVAEAISHRESDEAHLREILATTAHAELSRLERRAMLLSLFGQLLPLLGLIGTFIGGYAVLITLDAQSPMIQTGDVVRQIAGALVTTIAGLVGAAFCFTAHHILVLRTDELSLNMDTGVALMLDYLAHHTVEATDGFAEA